MDTIVQIALIASVFIVAASVLGVSWANARNATKGQIETLYEKENKALGQALSRQEQENARLLAKVEALAQSNLVLQETVSGAEAVKALRMEMLQSEKARQEEHGAMMMLIKDLVAQFRNRRGELG